MIFLHNSPDAEKALSNLREVLQKKVDLLRRDLIEKFQKQF